jgi:hypothetical protein
MLTTVYDAQLRGSVAYVAAGMGGIGVVDITRPEAPSLLDLADMNGHGAMRLAMDGDRLVAVNGGPWTLGDFGCMAIFDVREPERPILRSVTRLPSLVRDVAAAGGYVFLAAGSEGVVVIDARDDSQPIVIAQVGTGWWVKSVTVHAGHLLVADVTFGLRVLDIAAPRTLREVAGVPYHTQREPRGIALDGDTAYLPGSQLPLDRFLEQLPEDVLAIDVADPTRPRLLGGANLAAGPNDLAVRNGRLVLADAPLFNRFSGYEERLIVKDLSAPRGSGLVAILDLPEAPTGVVLADELAYVANGGSGMLIVRVGDPAIYVPTATPTRHPTAPTATRDPSLPTLTPGQPTSTAPPFPTETLRATPPPYLTAPVTPTSGTPAVSALALPVVTR